MNPSIAIFFAVTPRKCLKRFDLEPSAKIKKFFIDSRYLKRFSSGFVYILPPRGFERIGDNILSFNAVKPLLKIKVNPADFKHKVEAMKYEYRQDKIFDFNKVLKVAIKHAPKLNCNHDTGHILRSSIYARIMAIKTCPEYLNEIMLGVILHDIGRINNQRDPYHPKRSARLAMDILKKHWPGLNTGRIIYAIENHNMGKTTTDPVIGIIWDADRLDLVRLGIKVDKKLLSTKIAPKLIPLARLVCTKMKLS